MKIVIDPRVAQAPALGTLSADGRYLTINAPPAYNKQKNSYAKVSLSPDLTKAIQLWASQSQNLLRVKDLAWECTGYPLIPKKFDAKQPTELDGSEGVLGISIFLFDKATNKPLADDAPYLSLASFIDNVLPKGPFVLLDDEDQPRIEGLRRAPQADIAKFAPTAIFQGQVLVVNDPKTLINHAFALFSTIVDPTCFDEDKQPPTIIDRRYKIPAYIRPVATSTVSNTAIKLVFVPSIVAMVYEWPENGGTMVAIGPPFLDDEDAADAKGDEPDPADGDAGLTEAPDQLIVEIEPDEGDRAFYWIDKDKQLCAVAFKPPASGGGGRGLGQARSDAITDTDNYWNGPVSLGYALGFDMSRHKDAKEFATMQAVAAKESAVKAAIAVAARARVAANDAAAKVTAAQAASANNTQAAAAAAQAAAQADAAAKKAVAMVAALNNARTGWFEAETSRKAKAEQGSTYRGAGVAATAMDSQIRYLKNFETKSPPSKKNFPKSSIPYEATAIEATFSRFSRTFKMLTGNHELRTQKMKTQKLKTLPVAPGEPFRPEGVDLKQNPDKRLAAAAVMGPAIRTIVESMQLQAQVDANKKSVKLGKKSASATAVTKYALGSINNDQVMRSWWLEASAQLLKFGDPSKPRPVASDTVKAALRTQQEWCHLWGHGDGGSEIPQNFVAGSKHCNTEQLAIETGRRTRTGNMKGKITAYLLPQDGRRKTAASAETVKDIRRFGGYLAVCSTGDILKVYLASVQIYTDIKLLIGNSTFQALDAASKEKIAATVTARVAAIFANAQTAVFTDKTAIKKDDLVKDPRKALSNFLEWFTPLITPQLPVAMFIRYKIYEGKKLVFDHVFDAQKESFDFNEFQTLSTTVERVVANDSKDYAYSVNRKIYDRIRTENASNPDLFYVLFDLAAAPAGKLNELFTKVFTPQLDEGKDPAAIEKFVADVSVLARKASVKRSNARAKAAAPNAAVGGRDATGEALNLIAALNVYKYAPN